MGIHPVCTRRHMLGQSLGGLLAAGLWPGALVGRDAEVPSEIAFLVVNDLHYRDQRCGPWLESVVQQIRKRPETIDFCLVAGDLTENGTPEQMAAVRDILKAVGKPLHVVVGNHDYRSDDDRRPFEEAFPKSLNYSFKHRDWQFVCLDSSEARRAQVSVQGPTLRWLDDNLPKLAPGRPTVICTHFPLGPWVPMRVTNAEQVLERFKAFNLQAVFNGHFHGFTERRLNGTTLTTNRCCSFSRANHDGTVAKGYFLCRARDGKIEREFIEAPPIPAHPN